MKVNVDQDGSIVLEEVFNSVILKTQDKESMAICMRDSGFEFNYQGKWYEAKNGIVKKISGDINDLRLLFLFDHLGLASPIYDVDDSLFYIVTKDGNIIKENSPQSPIGVDFLKSSEFNVISMANKLLKFIIDDFINDGKRETEIISINGLDLIPHTIVCHPNLASLLKSKKIYCIDTIDEDIVMVCSEPESFGLFAYKDDSFKDYCLFANREPFGSVDVFRVNREGV